VQGIRKSSSRWAGISASTAPGGKVQGVLVSGEMPERGREVGNRLVPDGRPRKGQPPPPELREDDKGKRLRREGGIF